ncbi:MAG: PAS domain S-box protein [Actinomycetota bacterium]|nr:PAS domain S-box protein [Actinomycetota bacterium]
MQLLADEETKRLQALRSYQVLDSETESSFDRIAQTAARIFRTPMAFLSLVDENRQWFKSCVGYAADETSRDVSFCSHALSSDDVMVIPDAAADSRFAANPLVTGEPFIRFYAGAPLVTPSGERLGTLCIVDRSPRDPLDPQAQRILKELADLVMDLLEARKAGIERQAALTKADDANRLLAAAVESSIDAILTKDREGIVTSWNRAAESLYGYSAAEIVGRPVTMLVPEDLAGEERKILDLILRGDSIDHYETRRVGKGGRILDISLSVSPIRSQQGEILGAASIQRDIGPEKRIRQALEKSETALRAQTQAAERANLAKSEFLSRMSHELRTPLNAILGFGQLLEMDDLTEDQAENVAEMIRGGKHLLELINEVLDISRIETGRLALSLEPVPLAYVIDEATRLVRPLAAQRGIALTVELPDPELHVMADQQRLKQILINLLSNAIKYNRDNGAVTVSASPRGDGRIGVSVADTGSGIRPDLVEAIFTPFERLGAEATSIEGTGLGLAIGRRLTEAMGGSLGVESVVGSGSTFTLELHVGLDAGSATVSELPAPQLQPECVILYVEDNVSNLRLVERIIGRAENLRVTSCTTGSEAIDVAARERPHLVLLDLNLPDMPGHEVLHRLQLDPLTADIPVVVLSADATQGQIRRLLHSGARAYLTKPFDVVAFNEVIEDLLTEQGAERVLVEEAR